MGPWDEAPANVHYHEAQDEKDLLEQFIKYWRKEKFDIITGWNVNTFDITYLCNRVDRVFGSESHRKFSPWNMCDVREFKTNWGSTQQVFNLYGINVIDYLELYKKHTFVNQESYRLDHIANVELGKSKISYEEEGSLHHLYRNNYSKFLAYNVKDVTLVEDLEEKLGLMELILAMSYNAKCNYNDTFGMVKYWETIIYNFLKEQKIATPPQKLSQTKGDRIQGAYVKEPIVGKHEWVVSFDLNSLYPHIIMQYNISPEKMQRGLTDTSVEKLFNKETIVDGALGITPNGG